MLVHRIDTAVAAGFKARAHLFDIQLLADVQHQAATEQEAGRCQAVQGGGDRHHENAVIKFRQPVQAGDPLGDDVLVRREQIVGQGFPVWERQYRQLRRKKAQLLLKPVSALAVGGQ
ncbi:hypothetical protein D3C81_1512550 [compost metagenome]